MIACFNGATSRPYPLEEDLPRRGCGRLSHGGTVGREVREVLRRPHGGRSQAGPRNGAWAWPPSTWSRWTTARRTRSPSPWIAPATWERSRRPWAATRCYSAVWGDLHGRSKEEGIALVAEYVQPVCRAAAEFGCRIAIEPLGQARRHSRLRRGAGRHRAGGPAQPGPDVGLLPLPQVGSAPGRDSPDPAGQAVVWCMWTTRRTCHPPRSKTRTASIPGRGAMPLARLFRDLRDMGYAGPVSVELFNQTYYQQPIDTIARSAYDSLQPF